MKKFKYTSAISTLAWLLVIASVSAQDVLKTDIQDFEVHKRNGYGLCGNLKVLCGSLFAEGDTSDDLNEVKIDGKTTVENALNKIIQENPRYQWSVEEGVINITPKKKYRYLKNGKEQLDTIIKDHTINDTITWGVAYKLCNTAGLNCLPLAIIGPRQLCNKISLHLDKITVREALNKIVKADGMASWTVEYADKDKRPIIDIGCWRPGSRLFKGEPISTEKPETQQQPTENKISEVGRPITSPYWHKLFLFAVGLLIFYFIVKTFRAKIKPRG